MNQRLPEEENYARRFDLSLWRKLFAYTKPYRREVGLLVALAIGTAAVDVSFPLVTRRLIDDVVARGRDADFAHFAVGYLGLTVTLCLFVWTFVRVTGKVRTHVSHDIRRDGFANLQRLSFSFYDHRPVGWLMARMTSDCERLSNIMAWGLLDFFWGVTMMSGIAVVLLVLNLRLGLIVLAVVPVLMWISAVFQRRILKSSRLVRKTNSKITAAYNESIVGVRTSKVFVRQQENLREFRELTTEMHGGSVRNALQSALLLPLILTLGSVATGLTLVIGGLDVTRGAVTVGTLIAFLTYVRHFFDPVQELGHWFAEIQMAQASAERVIGLIETVPQVRDRHDVAARIRATGPTRPRGLAEDGMPDSIATIDFVNVGFYYQGGVRVLEGFDLSVRAGETIALVGPTGGGKSTIVSLLCRFYEPTSGEIRIDGVDYRERSLHWLQSSLGIVLQTPHLFSGTVAENIRYGRLDTTRAEIEEAATIVGAHAFIERMENGYESEVGEGGVLLSTGEKQLVSFARAILAKPRILVMDEATSSVDTKTEHAIQRALDRVLEGRTSFVIAHRLSTIRSADRILVIDAGRIVEQGPHAELMRARGRYHDLYVQQSLRESSRTIVDWDSSASSVLGGDVTASEGPATFPASS